ncbi:unnamed protein product [Gadus morhua 'NCC']
MELRAVLLYRRVDDGQVVNSTSGVDHQTAAPCVPAVQRQAGPVHALLLSWAHRRWVAERSNLLLSEGMYGAGLSLDGGDTRSRRLMVHSRGAVHHLPVIHSTVQKDRKLYRVYKTPSAPPSPPSNPSLGWVHPKLHHQAGDCPHLHH